MKNTSKSLRNSLNYIYGSLFNKKPFDETFKKFDESPTWRKICEEVFGKYLGQYSCTKPKNITKIVEELNISPHDHVLDMGSGLGGLSVLLAKESGCTLTGIDLSQEGVRRANIYAESHNLSEKVYFTTNRLPEIPYKDNHFNKIISIDSVYAIPDKTKLFEECFRVLKPNGRIGFLSIFFVKELEPKTLDDRKALRWRTTKPYEQIIEEVGFRDVSYCDYTNEHVLLARRWVELMIESEEALKKELGKKIFEGTLSNQMPVWKLAENGYIKRGLFKGKKH